MSRCVFVVCLISIALVPQTGCEALRSLLGYGFQRPKVDVRSISVASFNPLALKLRVKLRIKNPNSFDLDLSYMRYEIATSNQMNLAKGQYDKPLKVAKQGQAEVTLPVTINPSNAIKLAQEVAEQKHSDLKAVVTASFVFETSVGQIEHKFKDEHPLSNLKF